MGSAKFFDEYREQSIVKAEIVAKYFWSWANIIKKRARKLAYLDLFAGPGRYKDGSSSTPIMVLETAIAQEDMASKLVTLFNDVDSEHVESLKRAISEINGIEKLKYKPVVHNNEVGEKIVKMFEGVNLIPTLFFVDPWGYKGLSLRLINSVLKNWGCDCIFFFNYNRINMGICNPKVVEHMNALFGEERANSLRERVRGLKPFDREMTVVNELAMALKEMGGEYVLPFCFKNENGQRTSHHLVFVSKEKRGYFIMKDIMAKYSSEYVQGVPSFEYNPVIDKNLEMLFEFSRPLDELGEMLLSDFAGKSIRMVDIFERHNIGRPFVKKNYKDILKKLEAEGKITANPPAQVRPPRSGEVTFADKVVVTFPE